MDKTNLIVPMCGIGRRFKEKGYAIPKPLIDVGNKKILEWSFDSIDIDRFNPIFIIREDDCIYHNLDNILKDMFSNPIILTIAQDTGGAVDTCLYAKEYINNETPLAVFTLDVNFSPRFDGTMPDCDAGLLTFSSTSPNYSYSRLVGDRVVEVKEKHVISNNASVGIYWFKTGRLFVEAASKYTVEKGETHIAPLYNILIQEDKIVKIKEVDKIYIMGTPEEKDFIETILIDKTKPIGVVCDHSGWDAKNRFMKVLDGRDIDYVDFGCYDANQCDYSDYVPRITREIQQKTISYGFGFCRTGQGISIAANKQKDIRSALIFDAYTAKYSVKHNAANFFSIPEKFSTMEDLEVMLDMILNNSFDGGRHQDRLQKI